jgi:hypothetical protein
MMSELSITESQSEFYSNENRPCKRYKDGNDRNSIIHDSSDFMECSRKEMWKLMKSQINCSIVGLELFFDRPNEMDQCQTEEDALITLGIFQILFYDSYRMFWIETCTLPCIQVDNSCPHGHFLSYHVLPNSVKQKMYPVKFNDISVLKTIIKTNNHVLFPKK